MAATPGRPTGNVRYDNADRVILVTGGVTGIGRAIVDRFHQTGATVFSFDVTPNDHENSDRKTFLEGDTASFNVCKGALKTILDLHSGIDVLVNNAAIQPPNSYRSIDQYEEQLWQRMVDVNLTGYANMARVVLPVMKQQQSGVIVNLASGQGHRTARGVPAYGPIKAANIMQARQWAVEYARSGIRVASVSPGAIDTPMVRASLAAQGGADELANRHPQGRIGSAQEVANAVIWLCSDDASFVTGTDLEVDGGLGAFGAFADPF